MPFTSPDRGHRSQLLLATALLALLACGDEGEDTPRLATNVPGGGAGPAAGFMGPLAGTQGGGGAMSFVGGGGTGALPNGCFVGQQNCAGVCVDTNVDGAHCGACNVVCPTGTVCVNGACGCPLGQMLCQGMCADPILCTCPPGWQVCNGMCADVLSDVANCGACGMGCAGVDQVCDAGVCRSPLDNTCTSTCGGGRVCVNGLCECQAGQTFCQGNCVDTNTSDDHCSACDMACTGGMVCEGAACGCPDGQMECNGQCVDINTSVEHCGECDAACREGDACTAGRCSAPTGDDGCGGDALGISISEIAVYQSLKIPIAEGMQSIGANARNADVVQGRETVFRVFVDLDPGFAPRELSARLLLTNTSGEQQYYAKQPVSIDSSDGDAGSTFQIFVPADEIQAGTRYSVVIAECSPTASGVVAAPRFPATGDEALEARETGVLRVALVPVQVGGMLPETDDETLEVYRSYLAAMYPATEVELTVTESITTANPVNWTNTLDEVRLKRQQDSPDSDVYYYGLLRPTNTIGEFCARSCTAGVGFVGSAFSASTRAAIGLAYGNESSAQIMAHEVGHNHGRGHAPCAPGGQIQGVDGQFPYQGGTLGSWGYDPRDRRLFNPSQATDIMGYCDNQWISDYTYQGLVERIATLNGAPERVVPAHLIAPWWVMLLDAQGPRWSQPHVDPIEAFGEPELAEILDANGNALEYVTVHRTQIGDIDAATLLVPEPQPHWNAIRIQGAPPLRF